MKTLCLGTFFAAMLAMVVSAPVQIHGQGGFSHDAVGTVVVKELEYFGHGVTRWVEIPGTKAVGFSTDACDFVTAFSNIEEYERSHDWYVGGETATLRQKSVIRRMLEVSIGGRRYRGELRNVGVFPMGLNLACIDLPVPPGDIAGYHRLFVDDSRDDPDLVMPPDTLQGTPILSEMGDVVSAFIFDPRGASRFTSGADIREFLREVRKVPRSRPLLPPA